MTGQEKRRWALLVITLAAFGLRIWRLDAHAYRGDEAFATWFLAPDWGAVISAMARTEPHPPLFYLLTKVWRDLFGDAEFILRFLPAAFGTLCAPLIARVAWRVVPGGAGTGIGLVAALAVAVNPFNIWNSQDARMYAQVSALALASTWLLFSLESHPKDRAVWIAYGLTTLTAALSHYGFALILAAQLTVFLTVRLAELRAGPRRDAPSIVTMLTTQTVVGLVLAGWLFYNRAAFSGYGGNGSSPSLVDALRLTMTSVLFGRSGPDDWSLLLWLPILLIAIAGAVSLLLREGRRYESVSIAAATTVPFLVFWISSWRNPVFSETYLLPVQAFFLMFAIAGMAALRPVLKSFWPVLSVPIFAAAFVALNNYWWNPAYAKGADWRSEARAIQSGEQPGDIVVLNYPDPTFQYYYRGASNVVLLPGTSPFDPADVARQVDEVVRANRRIWLIPVRAGNWDSQGLVETRLNEAASVVGTADFHQVRLVLLETPAGALAATSPATAQFSDSIALKGTRIEADTAECRPECGAAIRLIWSASATPSTDYKIFIHVLDSRGAVAAQDDAVPAGWRRPTSGWKPQELIVDDHVLSRSLAAGIYRVVAGLYGADGARLPTLDGQDSIEIGTLSVR